MEEALSDMVVEVGGIGIGRAARARRIGPLYKGLSLRAVRTFYRFGQSAYYRHPDRFARRDGRVTD
ncbi:hypothetical protein DF156_05330 [Burkholderia ubonensis]|uniref:Uncharacterized protein n=1 Tax=Burkholderia ubonensis TaxID=101571 RepID=A0A1R1J4G9_9BURK|nr:hypothetical protein BW685_28490 [Burkholderia ubonensis]PAJ77341.1 hypothetical protein CJO71_30340 [Burkholderia ubonensis]PAJ83647.1 hypothetical protein CJO70_33090 [Burkholderia ubonensis]PAK04031.1 hypothetical protein CJO67_32310 [Burkholderia ubonensis]PAK10509.1 hypothetical protein CJO66_33735 [Burkholderia ubonensis]